VFVDEFDELLLVRRLLLPVDPLFIRSVVFEELVRSVDDEFVVIDPVPVPYVVVPVVGGCVPVFIVPVVPLFIVPVVVPLFIVPFVFTGGWVAVVPVLTVPVLFVVGGCV
jgi:hypothetical protein